MNKLIQSTLSLIALLMCLHHIFVSRILSWLLTLTLLFLSSASYASSPPANDGHICQILDYEALRARNSRDTATKQALNLNVGEPRTVRMIYFLPNDRSPIEKIDTKLDTLIKDIQRFYADEMERNGFGRKTFTLETDVSGKTLVHHVNGQYSASYYNAEGEMDVFGKILAEINEQFDTSQNIYFIAADVTFPGSAWRGGGQAFLGGSAIVYIPSEPHFTNEAGQVFVSWYHAGHELGHSFGLQHDFRFRTNYSEADIMSYQVGIDFENRRLSKCAAEWLDVHSYFNASETSPNDEPTAIRLLSPLAYPPNAISLRFEVTDADGIHQAQLIIPRESGFSLHDCKSLNREKNSTIEFITTELTATVDNNVEIGIIDVHGNFRWDSYSVYIDEGCA